MTIPDIDIDFSDRNEALKHIKHIPASIINDEIKKHTNGVYFCNIPVDPGTQLPTIDYKEAEERGYVKIDFLNLSIYKDIKNEKHLNKLLDKEPIWELLEEEEFVKQLLHLHDHFHTVVKHMPPKNINQLAMVLAMRLPSKKYLVGESWEKVEKEIWVPTNEYYFKKSHAIAYAHAVVVHMNLLVEQL